MGKGFECGWVGKGCVGVGAGVINYPCSCPMLLLRPVLEDRFQLREEVSEASPHCVINYHCGKPALDVDHDDDTDLAVLAACGGGVMGGWVVMVRGGG
jgi:hypothetical protein